MRNPASASGEYTPGPGGTEEATHLFLTPPHSEALDRCGRCCPRISVSSTWTSPDPRSGDTGASVRPAHFKREDNHVEGFCAEHARELLCLTCFFPVEDLTVADEIEVLPGVRFLSGGTGRPYPLWVLGPDPLATMASVVAVDNCTGTDHANIRSAGSGARAARAADSARGPARGALQTRTSATAVPARRVDVVQRPAEACGRPDPSRRGPSS